KVHGITQVQSNAVRQFELHSHTNRDVGSSLEILVSGYLSAASALFAPVTFVIPFTGRTFCVRVQHRIESQHTDTNAGVEVNCVFAAQEVNGSQLEHTIQAGVILNRGLCRLITSRISSRCGGTPACDMGLSTTFVVRENASTVNGTFQTEPTGELLTQGNSIILTQLIFEEAHFLSK